MSTAIASNSVPITREALPSGPVCRVVLSMLLLELLSLLAPVVSHAQLFPSSDPYRRVSEILAPHTSSLAGRVLFETDFEGLTPPVWEGGWLTTAGWSWGTAYVQREALWVSPDTLRFGTGDLSPIYPYYAWTFIGDDASGDGGCHSGTSCAVMEGSYFDGTPENIQGVGLAVVISPLLTLPPAGSGEIVELRFWARTDGILAIAIAEDGGPYTFEKIDPATSTAQTPPWSPPATDRSLLPWHEVHLDLTASANRTVRIVFTQSAPRFITFNLQEQARLLVIDDIKLGLAKTPTTSTTTTTSTSTSTTTTTLAPPCASDRMATAPPGDAACTLEALKNTLNDPAPLSCRTGCDCEIGRIIEDIGGLLSAAVAAPTTKVCRTEWRLAHRKARHLRFRVGAAIRQRCLTPGERARRLVPWAQELLRRTGMVSRSASCKAASPVTIPAGRPTTRSPRGASR